MSTRTAPASIWWGVYRSLAAAGNAWTPPPHLALPAPGHHDWLLPDVPDVPDVPGVHGVPRPVEHPRT
ncbi:hypothetical protein [Streptomyces radiopugnans]|uniref:Uncharacterized protein n=1 Tax=Streptomyces radiopugnans TaxID=403935 RepID=A0A1H9CXA9_9ACTN|nr:hypothetical protein [Streptomyces radiopugnans]SEQ05779.1 hypothetical protein SAMN05216481_103491 [Streptomyces radiopugnans]